MSPVHSKQPGLLVRLSAELGIIILGVLIALWADGWVAERADREAERSRIEALRDNLTATRTRLNDAVQEAQRAQAALKSIAYWQAPGMIAEHEDMVVAGLFFGPAFTPEINVYSDLKNSGDLGLLSNADLRQALAHMDAVFEQLMLLQSDLTMVQQLNYDPFIVRELALGTTLGQHLGLQDLPTDAVNPDVDMQQLRNLALFKLDLVNLLESKYRESGKALDTVERAMGGNP